jgi:hypothetical protein
MEKKQREKERGGGRMGKEVLGLQRLKGREAEHGSRLIEGLMGRVAMGRFVVLG